MVSIAAAVCFTILVGAGGGHLRDLPGFHRAIRAHDVWPVALTMPLAVSVAALEASIGMAGIASLILSGGAALHASLLAAAGSLYLSYAVYGGYLLRRRPGVPCACSRDSDPVDVATVARVAVLGALAIVALVHVPLAQGLSASEVIVTVLAVVSYSLAAWALPGSLQDPFTTIAAGQVRRAG